jgi:hypothetical protein
MTATPGAGVVNDYLILQYGRLIFGLLPARRFPPPWSIIRQAPAFADEMRLKPMTARYFKRNSAEAAAFLRQAGW